MAEVVIDFNKDGACFKTNFPCIAQERALPNKLDCTVLHKAR